MSAEDNAYLAGILDGEGSLSAGYNGDLPQVFVAVGMSDPTIPTWIAQTYGGKVYRCQNTGRGSWNWQVNGLDCRPVIEAAFPHLKLKRRSAELVLAFVDTIRPREDRSVLSQHELIVKVTIAEELRSLTL